MFRRMGRQVDLDDITDSTGVAEVLGLSHSQSVGTYRKRYPDFPQPVVNLGGGRCLLWLRSDIETWMRSRGRSRHPSGHGADTTSPEQPQT